MRSQLIIFRAFHTQNLTQSPNLLFVLLEWFNKAVNKSQQLALLQEHVGEGVQVVADVVLYFNRSISILVVITP